MQAHELTMPVLVERIGRHACLRERKGELVAPGPLVQRRRLG
jgi:hypothetical protein